MDTVSAHHFTLRSLIEGYTRLFIFQKYWKISIDFNVVKYFFHPARLFIYYSIRVGCCYPARLLGPTLILGTLEYQKKHHYFF